MRRAQLQRSLLFPVAAAAFLHVAVLASAGFIHVRGSRATEPVDEFETASVQLDLRGTPMMAPDVAPVLPEETPASPEPATEAPLPLQQEPAVPEPPAPLEQPPAPDPIEPRIEEVLAHEYVLGGEGPIPRVAPEVPAPGHAAPSVADAQEATAPRTEPAVETPRETASESATPAATTPGPAATPAAPLTESSGSDVARSGSTAVGSGAGSTAPQPKRPLRARSTPRPEYPAAARARGEQGTVTCRLTIDATGAVVDVELVKSCGSADLDSAALRALRRWRFDPIEGFSSTDRVRVLQNLTFELAARHHE